MSKATQNVAGAEAAAVPVVEPRSAQGQIGPCYEPGGRSDLAVGEGTGPGDELVGRARSVLCLDSVVRQRLVWVVGEGPEAGHADPRSERVVVVSRQAYEGEHLARRRGFPTGGPVGRFAARGYRSSAGARRRAWQGLPPRLGAFGPPGRVRRAPRRVGRVTASHTSPPLLRCRSRRSEDTKRPHCA